ncbi:OLC1v1027770C1 [Oldenlandia corymbosa var. corymbosa]|uniref:OLC1v1027770C1 n=1 Tax=Oldenlandia corymbosa var. corymbosa TaxID=529605 RepID=A0AAV1CCY6_OLDCO|nr:OLC1v1027770C1 [Oldenlandia corymbosa var. corymbosa]
MVKLASARESRMYGPRLSRNRLEYINAGLYVFASIVLLSGFAAQFSSEPKSGLVLLLIALAIFTIVNVHDLMAHLAGIDYRFTLMEYDMQLAVVEFAAPLVLTLGTILFFLGIFFILFEAERGYGLYKLEHHALNMLIAGSTLWLLGSIINSCQIYERADGHVQILQGSVSIPFLMGSLLFIVGAILNSRERTSNIRHSIASLAEVWVWMGIFGSLLFFIGGLLNVVKVFKMQQGNVLRLEKLRGGAQERLIHIREGQVPFIVATEEPSRRRSPPERAVEEGTTNVVQTTPYKDVLVGQT